MDYNKYMPRLVPWKPTKEQLLAAKDKTVKDVIAPGLDVLFVGLNPGLYTAAIGRHFGRPGNRFWPALCASGLLKEPLTPWESGRLIGSGLGITNIVSRATATGAELSDDELRAGAKAVRRKVLKYKPKNAAFLGIGLYRVGFERPDAKLGLQQERIGDTKLWVFPNPSGLNAHFQVPDYARLFARLLPYSSGRKTPTIRSNQSRSR